MKTSPKISVIVPIYNAEIYLRRCVDSLLAQTFTDFELLLIDDGSPDNSGQICDEYAQKDHRVRVFHKKNGGVASARQMGTDVAQGEYIIHADPDDWVDAFMLAEMYDVIVAKDADLLFTNFFIDRIDGIKYKKQQTELSSQELLKNILKGNVMGVLWNKLIKRELYKKYKIRYIEDINYCEDVLILAQLLIHDEIKISYLNKAFYHYNTCNNNSITQNYTKDSFLYRKKFILSLEKMLSDKYKNELDSAALDVKFEAFSHHVLSETDYKGLRPHTIKTVLQSTLSFKGKVFFIVASIGFFDLSSSVYQIMKNIKRI